MATIQIPTATRIVIGLPMRGFKGLTMALYLNSHQFSTRGKKREVTGSYLSAAMATRVKTDPQTDMTEMNEHILQ